MKHTSIISLALGAAAVAGAAAAAATVLADAAQPAFVTEWVPIRTIQPSPEDIMAAQATVEPLSPTSNVKGAAFDRVVQIWLENQEFKNASVDPNMQWLARQGILLTNYFAVTHPSQPNYAAAVCGDTFGMDHDEFVRFPANISTVVDLLDTKGISWGEYQEHQPYAGYEGFNFTESGEDDYVRKHNPLILFDSVTNNASRIRQIKNFTSFAADLEARTLPQWSFLTPNMTNDAHDTNMTFSAKWTRGFIEPLLKNPYFMERTLLILTFDEGEVFANQNRVFTVLMGGAVPKALHGTTDNMYYNLYSTISTVSSNWGLPSLGRWDCATNVFDLVAAQTGYTNTNVSLAGLYFNDTYPGAVGRFQYTAGWWPAPNTLARCVSGEGVLPAVVDVWGKTHGAYNYTNVYPYNEPAGVATGGVPAVGFMDRDVEAGGEGEAGVVSSSSSSAAAASGTSVGVAWWVAASVLAAGAVFW
ncbi:phosphoesterase family-domain-containing protein [Podospora appendiculata]|uniref:acid phosphatase n=1 Tax=Podospora appendiculata TaxID=314037 RepID=A0AAE0XFC1_9PEZI|nr:phosphoesterase family-domain-containing protein [Podospora appendiculata]